MQALACHCSKIGISAHRVVYNDGITLLASRYDRSHWCILAKSWLLFKFVVTFWAAVWSGAKSSRLGINSGNPLELLSLAVWQFLHYSIGPPAVPAAWATHIVLGLHSLHGLLLYQKIYIGDERYRTVYRVSIPGLHLHASPITITSEYAPQPCRSRTAHGHLSWHRYPQPRSTYAQSSTAGETRTLQRHPTSNYQQHR